MTPQVFFESSLTQTDPMVLDAIKNEYHRQNDQIELLRVSPIGLTIGIENPNVKGQTVLERRFLNVNPFPVPGIRDREALSTSH